MTILILFLFQLKQYIIYGKLCDYETQLSIINEFSLKTKQCQNEFELTNEGHSLPTALFDSTPTTLSSSSFESLSSISNICTIPSCLSSTNNLIEAIPSCKIQLLNGYQKNIKKELIAIQDGCQVHIDQIENSKNSVSLSNKEIPFYHLIFIILGKFIFVHYN